jgi:hypothetical protein
MLQSNESRHAGAPASLPGCTWKHIAHPVAIATGYWPQRLRRSQKIRHASGVRANSRWLSATRDTTGFDVDSHRHPGRGAGNPASPECITRHIAHPVAIATGYWPQHLRRSQKIRHASGVRANSRWLSATRDTAGFGVKAHTHPGRGAGTGYSTRQTRAKRER